MAVPSPIVSNTKRSGKAWTWNGAISLSVGLDIAMCVPYRSVLLIQDDVVSSSTHLNYWHPKWWRHLFWTANPQMKDVNQFATCSTLLLLNMAIPIFAQTLKCWQVTLPRCGVESCIGFIVRMHFELSYSFPRSMWPKRFQQCFPTSAIRA